MFIPLMRFLLQGLVSRSFLVRLRCSFIIFSFIFACLMRYAFNIPKYLYFFKILSVRSDFSSFDSCMYPFRYLSFSIFLYYYGTFFMANSIPISYLYFLDSIRIYNSLSFFENCLRSSMYI